MRILIADDHDLVRETIGSFLTNQSGIRQVDTVANLDEAIASAEKLGPYDLTLLDYNMPGMQGLAGLKRMQNAKNAGPVAIISGTANATVAQDAIAKGAMGFIPKTLGSKSIVSAIKFMIAGEKFIPFDFLQQQSEPSQSGNLTARETSVLRALCEGKSNKEIARSLDLQEVTIKLHVKNLCNKLEARNRTHAAMIAKERSLV